MARVIEPIGRMSMGLLVRRTQLLPYSTKAKSPASASKPKSEPKAQQATAMKSLYRENKEIFGKLLEPKRVKLKKEKKLRELGIGNEIVVHEDVLLSQSDLGPGRKTGVSTTTRTSVSIADRSTNVVTKAERNNEEERAFERIEASWAIKNFPARAKILNRAKPETPLYSFDETSTSSARPPGQFKVIVKDRDSPSGGKKTGKVKELGSVRQFITSLEDCQDIGESGQFRLIRKSEEPSTEAVRNEPDYYAQESLINGNSKTGENCQPVEPAKPEKSSTLSTSSHDPAAEVGGDNCQADLVSAGYKLFPYENPRRGTGLSEPSKIISLPFPFTKSNASAEGTKARLPSVSKILNVTMPPEQVEILRKWEEKMKEQMGEEGFKKYKDDLFRNGKELHANLERVLSGTPVEELTISGPIAGHWKSLRGILTQIGNVHVLESHVSHPELRYCGIVDCLAIYKDKLVLIDWKTSEKPKPFVSMTYDTPLQIAAYIGAINYDPNYSLKVKEGLIVVAYQSGDPGQIFQLNSVDLGKYWKEWVRRLKLFQSQQH